MRVTVDWNGDYQFKGTNETGESILIDAGRSEGGADHADAPAPTQVLLMSLGACMATNVVTILRKKRATLHSLQLVIEGDKAPEPPTRFTDIRVTYHVKASGVTPPAMAQVAELVDKYCGVGQTLVHGCPVHFGVEFSQP